MKSPILFLVFNRPDLTRKVFEVIRSAKPPKLYISADGPRESNQVDLVLCRKVRDIINDVDWDCEVHTNYYERNLGCKIAVSSGISWFFEHECEGIILEDDVLPTPSFFPFCDQLLERFRNNLSVGMISGSNLVSNKTVISDSYFITAVPLIWGWATWRRAWQQYDVRMEGWPKMRKNKELSQIFHGDWLSTQYWTDVFDRVYQGQVDTWDYQLLFSFWSHGLLSVNPSVNLTNNLGFGLNATHVSSEMPRFLLESPPGDLSFPLMHPSKIESDWIRDRMIFLHVHGVNWLSYLRKILRPLRFIKFSF